MLPPVHAALNICAFKVETVGTELSGNLIFIVSWYMYVLIRPRLRSFVGDLPVVSFCFHNEVHH